MLFFKTIKVNFFKIYIGQTYLNSKDFLFRILKNSKDFLSKKKEAKHEKTENFFNF
jgi:hypothetical protein